MNRLFRCSTAGYANRSHSTQKHNYQPGQENVQESTILKEILLHTVVSDDSGITSYSPFNNF